MKRNIIALLCAIILAGCAQDNLIEKQQAAANDLSGKYVSLENGAKSVMKMNFEIKNEQDHFDINMTARREKLSPQEISFYNTIGISPSYAESLVKLSAFGVGRLSWEELPQSLQADSVSYDKGKTTKFLVCTGLHNWNDKYWIRHCMTGTSAKNSGEINGKVHTYISTSVSNGENFIHYKVMVQPFIGNIETESAP